MRLALISLLMIPLTLGCGDKSQDSGATDAAGSSGTGSYTGTGDGNCLQICDRVEALANRCAPAGTVVYDSLLDGAAECFDSCLYGWEAAHRRECVAEYGALLGCVADIRLESISCDSGDLDLTSTYCGDRYSVFDECTAVYDEPADTGAPSGGSGTLP